MSIFSRIFPKKRPAPGVWPNHPTWGAMKNGVTMETDDGPRSLWTVTCGELLLPSGRLAVCDPFARLAPSGTPFIVAPAGTFPVVVTLTDISERQDKSRIREAYASIVFSAEDEAYRKPLPLAAEGERRREPKAGEFAGFAIDSGNACFIDESMIGPGMPDPQTWKTTLFENGRPDSWSRQMENPHHIHSGMANIPLPQAKHGENVILFQSGWGDGHYPVIGSFDANDELVAAHIDFLVLT